MLAGKGSDVRHAVSHLTADGIETLEDSALNNMLLAIFDDAVELIETLGSLGVKIDIFREIQLTGFLQLLHILKLLYHDGMTLRLPHQSEHLSMPVLAENHDLCLRIVDILLLDAALQLEHHRTGSIDDFNVVSLSKGISFRRFTMSTEQDLYALQFLHLLMVYRDESRFMQALHFHTVMHNIAQAVKFTALSQLLFSFLDGSGYAKAEPTAVIYFYLHDIHF